MSLDPKVRTKIKLRFSKSARKRIRAATPGGPVEGRRHRHGDRRVRQDLDRQDQLQADRLDRMRGRRALGRRRVFVSLAAIGLIALGAGHALGASEPITTFDHLLQLRQGELHDRPGHGGHLRQPGHEPSRRHDVTAVKSGKGGTPFVSLRHDRRRPDADQRDEFPRTRHLPLLLLGTRDRDVGRSGGGRRSPRGSPVRSSAATCAGWCPAAS